jgi:hypothetical protein
MAANEVLRKLVAEKQGAVEAEKTWWAAKKAHTSETFMKELESEKGEDAVLVEGGGPAAGATKTTAGKKGKGKN